MIHKLDTDDPLFIALMQARLQSQTALMELKNADIAYSEVFTDYEYKLAPYKTKVIDAWVAEERARRAWLHQK